MKSSKLKEIIVEMLLRELNKSEQDSVAYRKGMEVAAYHKRMNRKFSRQELSQFSKDFQKGYSYTMGDSFYNKANGWATDFISRFGFSRQREL